MPQPRVSAFEVMDQLEVAARAAIDFHATVLIRDENVTHEVDRDVDGNIGITLPDHLERRSRSLRANRKQRNAMRLRRRYVKNLPGCARLSVRTSRQNRDDQKRETGREV